MHTGSNTFFSKKYYQAFANRIKKHNVQESCKFCIHLYIDCNAIQTAKIERSKTVDVIERNFIIIIIVINIIIIIITVESIKYTLCEDASLLEFIKKKLRVSTNAHKSSNKVHIK